MSYRIVVADKDPRSREAVARYLVQEDSEFINVSSSGELKEAIKNKKPDLIILNSVLADAPGWRLVQRIKGSRDFSHIPVLLMTGDPGGPPPAEARTSGADGYLSKPFDGATLKETVESLLGMGSGAGGSGDDEIMIDFTDEDSGEMTEELLAMSNVALAGEEPSTEVGDTVEIDTGTLVAELDHTSEMAKDETYEDTVRLNLEDMGLEEEADAYEPTIELVSDQPMDFGDAPASEALEIDLDSDVFLPDFEAATIEVTDSARGARHSVTVEMDVDDLGLELESEQPLEEFGPKKLDRIDPDDTEIGQLLDVQEPSRVLTSEDLMLDDDSLVKDAAVSREFDVIDLEEDSEIREIEMEELEAIHAPEEDIVGIDLDETVPLEDQEMQLLANEDLQEIQLDDSEDVTLETESPAAAMPSYESTEELTLDEIGEEEITTQEFFGEELPTEEFPTERFPEEKTRDLGLEQVSLDYAEGFPQEISLDQRPAAGETPLEEVTLDSASAEDILFDQTREEEPMLEVTEDISFDEVSLEDEADEFSREKLVAAPRPSTAHTIAGIAGGALAVGAVAAAVGKIAGVAEKGEKPPQAGPPTASFAEPRAAAAAGMDAMAHSAGRAYRTEQIEPIAAPFPGEGVKETPLGRADFMDSFGTAQAGARREIPETSETFRQAPQSALPTKQELLNGIMRDLASSLPTREDIFSRVDEIIGRSLPSEQEIAQRVDRAVQAALPSPEAIGERLEKALRSILPREEIGKRFEAAVGRLLSSDRIKETMEAALKAVPSQDFVKQRLEKALSTAISPELVAERVDVALRGMPSQEYIRIRLDNAFAALPSSDIVNERLNTALRAIPTSDQIMNKIDESLQALTSPEGAIARIDDRLLSFLPSKDEIGAAFQTVLERRIQDVLAGVDLKELVATLLPSTDRILETIKSALPEEDRFRETLSYGMAEAIQNSLPERVWLESVSRGLFDERTRGLLPKREEIATMLREEIHLRLLDTVEKVIREQIEKVTSELS